MVYRKYYSDKPVDDGSYKVVGVSDGMAFFTYVVLMVINMVLLMITQNMIDGTMVQHSYGERMALVVSLLASIALIGMASKWLGVKMWRDY